MVDVKTEYSKDSNLKPNDVQALMTWVKQQPHLPDISEIFAIVFLKKNHYRIEPAKSTIDTYFSWKKLWPEIFDDRNVATSPTRGALDTMHFSILPRKTPDDKSIIFIKILNSDILKYDLAVLLKFVDMVTILDLLQNGTSSAHLAVVDVGNFPFEYLSKLDFSVLKRFFYYMQEVMPIVRFEGIHYINPVPFMDEILTLVQSTVPKSIVSNIRAHKSLNDFKKYVPLEYLPVDYGGSVESVAELQEKIKNNLLENCGFFEREVRQVADENKRLSENKNVGNIF